MKLLNRPTRHSVCTAIVALGLAPLNASGQDAISGRSLYQTHCASCHGENGQPMMGGAPDFTRGEGLFQSDAALYDSIRSTRTIEHGFEGLLEQRQIYDIIAYLRDFF